MNGKYLSRPMSSSHLAKIIGILLILVFVIECPSLHAAQTKGATEARQETGGDTFPGHAYHTATSPGEKILVAAFREYASALSVPATPENEIRVAAFKTFMVASNGQYLMRVDCSGNQVFRPVKMATVHAKLPLRPYEAKARDDWQQLLATTQSIQKTLNRASEHIQTSSLKREVLGIQQCKASATLQGYEYRRAVRLYNKSEAGTPWGIMFQITFTPDGKPLRVDTNVRTASMEELIKFLRTPDYITANPDLEPSPQLLTLGLFYSSSEDRFPLNAKSYESQELDLLADHNPYEQKDALHFWWYEWWNLYGRVNGIRGNRDPKSQRWSTEKVSIVMHSLDEYPTVENTPGDSQHMRPEFYRDLEKLNIATFFTHGGPVRNQFQLGGAQFSPGNGSWFKMGNPDYKLGSGNLRHILFQGCGALGALSEEGGGGYKSLFGEWLPAYYVQGLRTVCGADGGNGENERDGWRFFGHYNQGDSISESWAADLIDESVDNCPVTVAYGASRQEALTTLLDGRFETARANPVWAAASI